ncbi:MAG: mannosyltransferase family protein [Microgenomates group bacterium]
MSLISIIKKVVVWRLLIFAVAVAAMFILPARPRFTNLTPTASTGDLLTMWSNFDGLHFLSIAEYRYDYPGKTDMSYAFFPVYPWLIGTLNIFGSYIISGLFLSHLFFIAALFFLYRLVLLDEKPRIAKSTIFLVLLFPTSVFFGSVYSESLFLLLAVLSFYFVRKKYFLLACLAAMIASATRITGIFLWPAIAYEFWLTYGKSLKRSLNPSAIWLALPPLGLLSYMRFQLEKVGDPLFFAHIQSVFTGRSTDKLILVHQVFYRYFRMLFLTDPASSVYFTVVLEFLSASLILGVLILSIRRIRFSYWFFILLSFVLPSLSGTFMSVPRYALVLFPVFIFLAKFLDRLHPFVRYAYYVLCIILSILSVAFFTRGYFIG